MGVSSFGKISIRWDGKKYLGRIAWINNNWIMRMENGEQRERERERGEACTNLLLLIVNILWAGKSIWFDSREGMTSLEFLCFLLLLLFLATSQLPISLIVCVSFYLIIFTREWLNYRSISRTPNYCPTILLLTRIINKPNDFLTHHQFNSIN